MQTTEHRDAGHDSIYRQRTHELGDLDGMAKAMREDGFVLIKGVLSGAECRDLREAIDRLDPVGLDHMGRRTDMFKCVFNRAAAFRDMIDRPGVVDLAERLLGDECHIIGETAWRSRPGHDGWKTHTDRVFVEMPEDMVADPRFELPVFVCTAHYYLTDVTLDTAPTWIVPGSHRSGRALAWGKEDDPEWHGRKLEPVLCKAGDVLIFRSELWHTGSKNASEDEVRYLLQVHYAHRFIAQHFTPYLEFKFDPSILDSANPRQRRLLGEHKRAEYD